VSRLANLKKRLSLKLAVYSDKETTIRI